MTEKIKRPIVIFKTNRDKLVELLTNKIAILNYYFYSKNQLKIRDDIKTRLEILGNILKIQDHDNSELSDKGLKDFAEFIYQLVENIIN